MLRELALISTTGLLILSLVTQLVAIGEDTSNKAVDYAQDMNMATDCAFKGIPLEECVPDLNDTNFSSEIERTKSSLSQINDLEE
jgi:hypothetical protein